MDQALLDIPCDPVSKTPLIALDKADLGKLNEAIAGGDVVTVEGEPVPSALEAALITEDRRVIYPIEDDIPILLADRGIGTTQLNGF